MLLQPKKTVKYFWIFIDSRGDFESNMIHTVVKVEGKLASLT